MTDSNYNVSATVLLVTIALLGGQAGAHTQERAVAVETAYIGELWHNVRGGIDSGSIYLDNLGMTARIDAESLLDGPGTRLLIEGLYNNGNSLYGRLTGDLQTVSNIESGPNELRLYQALVTTAIGDAGSLRAGLYDLNSEFDVLESANLFIHSAHGIGNDIGQTGRNGPSIFPVTSLGVRFAWRWNDAWRSRVAALDGVPGEDGAPNEMGVDLGDGDGALLAAELERDGPDGKLLLGAWRYTAEFAPWPDGGASGDPDPASGNHGAYVRGEWHVAEDVRLFGRYGWARGRFNPSDHFVSAGLTRTGLLPGRADDTFGIALAWAEASNDYRNATGLQGPRAAPREVAVEITYRMQIADAVVLQPDVQWIHNPGLGSGRCVRRGSARRDRAAVTIRRQRPGSNREPWASMLA